MSLHLPKHHWGTRGMDAYEKLECIGAGTYGQVYMAKDKATGDVVAIKKIRSLNEVQGLPVTTIREIKVLKCLNHPNLVELKEVVVSSENDDDDAEFTDKDEPLDYCHGSIYLVLEYLEHDLTGLIDRQHPFDDTAIKCLMKQLLDVMQYMHSIDIIHRDIKCSNLLMTRDHLLKVADFGLARSLRGDQLFTNKVVTLWYRPPELLLGATSYDASIDMWSIGCVFAELYIGHPLFQGKTELEQITKIFDICGTPTTESWPDYKFLTHSSTFVPDKPKPKRLREYLMRETAARKRILPKGALELMEALLVLDPEQRLTASDCLNSHYFKARPLPPSDPKKLPPITNLPSSHEYQTKKIRREQAKQLNGGGNNHSNSNTGAAAAVGGGRASRPTSPPGASSGGRSRQNAAKDSAEVAVKTEIKREEDPGKKRRRVA
ncbi:Cyclin-dependent kinase [Phytophthora fragariae]|uniref:Cyclin-dependent kinase 2 homolog n=1 Tax=Phytophthora fragariae TaxID=53985 RepID=A0A6A3ZJT7_9STRA|nr:Cyclin-dependent kinase [Phytophthora fragariae]KAE8949953.1 Cyclin-dependent kinase [Phytophthora fragariae]KAE9140789.1 Cyclin-dependent kinase [Phytophthora fragariae]KAE9155751.1 Cyclin-dependent kinase [Phytophthora fragariae]KAE9237784.1 Cyclin-dependent kinase [Phytophthora fragariae]